MERATSTDSYHCLPIYVLNTPAKVVQHNHSCMGLMVSMILGLWLPKAGPTNYGSLSRDELLHTHSRYLQVRFVGPPIPRKQLLGVRPEPEVDEDTADSRLCSKFEWPGLSLIYIYIPGNPNVHVFSVKHVRTKNPCIRPFLSNGQIFWNSSEYWV